eukprot:12731-Heterococcus_DN1.PRE.3
MDKIDTLCQSNSFMCCSWCAVPAGTTPIYGVIPPEQLVDPPDLCSTSQSYADNSGCIAPALPCLQ